MEVDIILNHRCVHVLFTIGCDGNVWPRLSFQQRLFQTRFTGVRTDTGGSDPLYWQRQQ